MCYCLLKLSCYVIIITTVTYMFLVHSPNLLDIEPQAFTPKLLKFEGALAVNKDLDKANIILKDQVLGPESLEVKNGEIYVSVADGKIIVIKDDKILRTAADLKEGSRVSSHPLGLRFFKEDLYVADADRGILKVEIGSGKVTVLVPKSQSIDGKPLTFADDLDVDGDVLYFSDMSTKWTIHQTSYAFMEHENSGRVCKLNLGTGKVEVLLDDLYMPNGIQITHDRKSLLVAELLKNRILRYHLSGPQKGQTEVFAELPGEPDNIRPSSRGGYWVALASGRDSSSPHLGDYLATYPKIRKAMARFTHAFATGLDWINRYISSPGVEAIAEELRSGRLFMLLLNLDHPVVIELGADGKIVRSLHSTNPKFAVLSQGLEYNGHLYLGSFIHPYIVKVKL